MHNMRYILWIIVFAVIAAVTAFSWLRQPPGGNDDTITGSGSTASVTRGEAQIGGDFTLTDQYGNNVSAQDLRGKYALVFFGFTHCPEICPTALLTISNSLREMGDEASSVIPVFITVDPQRDTVERMAEYMRNFHPRMLALTGTPQRIKQVEAAYKVYAQRVDDENNGQYTMNHSGFIYLMDRKGNYLTHFAYNVSQEELTRRLRELK